MQDHQIGEERQRHNLTGGCTACVALFILGKVFVSNAGDSRGVIALKSNPISMSFDFTPETETQRIRKIVSNFFFFFVRDGELASLNQILGGYGRLYCRVACIEC